MATAAAATTRELARATTPAIREMLADISVGLTREVALTAPKIFQLNYRLGPCEVIKLLVILVAKRVATD